MPNKRINYKKEFSRAKHQARTAHIGQEKQDGGVVTAKRRMTKKERLIYRKR